MPDYETLLVSQEEGGVMVVTLNRPERLNAMNTQMMTDLRTLFEDLYVHPDQARAVILTGAGERGFCPGADLKERDGMTDETWRAQHAIVEQFIRHMFQCPLPLIAAVNGVAMGGGGEIDVESQVGLGTTFRVGLDLAVAEADHLAELGETTRAPASTDRSGDEGSYPGLRALVVDDNPVNLLVTSEYLKVLEVEPVMVEDGPSALDQVADEAFDLVFMDVQLPGMDGLETTRRIRVAEPVDRHLPIVALTANVAPEDHRACLDAGMDLTVHKPMAIADLRAAMEDLRSRGLLQTAAR